MAFGVGSEVVKLADDIKLLRVVRTKKKLEGFQKVLSKPNEQALKLGECESM